MKAREQLPRLVLVGGGHAHVQVLRGFAMNRPPVALTVVVDQPLAVYSGMVPGVIAGQYRREEIEIDLVPLARRAGAQVILSRALRFSPRERRLELEGRPAIPYDLLSWNIGSTVAGADLPGIRELAIPTRPIGRFLDCLTTKLEALETLEGPRIAIVGGGAGGTEVAFTLQQRLHRQRPRVTLLHDGAHLLPGFSYPLRRRVGLAAEKYGLEVLLGHRVVGAHSVEDGVELRFERGSPRRFDLLIWVTGARGLAVFKESGVAVDKSGFAWVRPTLQLLDHDNVFAVGDCASLESAPATPKAGVYSVRQGPVLEHNLRAVLARRPLGTYRPQGQFLALLNLGDGRAIGGKWGLSFEGPAVMRLKDSIDRKFMRMFQVLGEDGSPTAMFPVMRGEPMTCGGCAAKVGQTVLERALGRLAPPLEDSSVLLGLHQPDDVAAWRTPKGDVIVATLDAFKAFCDDPWLVGRVAAINAASDALAKGAHPRLALALVAVPEGSSDDRQEETLFQVLAGMRAALDPLGIALVGGHSTLAAELLVGLSLFGEAGAKIPGELPTAGHGLMLKGGVGLGQRLILSKALGTGVIFHADMAGLARGPWVEAAVASALRTNESAARVARRAGATAVTDITGFGLLGHLTEMVRASGLAARLDIDALPSLPGAEALLARGLRSTFHHQNARLLQGVLVDEGAWRHPRFELLLDPQTSGGLLMAVAPEKVGQALEWLHQDGDDAAAVVGEITEPPADGSCLRLRCP